MALLPPLADSVRMSATLGLDAHPSFYSSHVDVSGTDDSSHVILTFHSSGPEEVFQKPRLDTVEVNDSFDSQEDSPLPPVRRKRAIRRYTEFSSEDEYVPKSVRRRSRVSYRESDSSSEGETDCVRLPQALSSSKHEGSQKLKLVLELLSQSKAIESVLHVGCRIQSLEAVPAKPELPPGVFRGCPSCRTCQKVVATWRPDAGRRPCLDEAPVFYPTDEEFEHPLKYLASIRARAEPFGICRIVPPQSWKPPNPLRDGSPELQTMQFPTRVQQVHKLQVREPTAKEYSPGKQASKKRRGQTSNGRMGGLANCNISAPLDYHQEFFGFEPGDPFPLGAFEKYANDFRDQYFRISERQSSGSEQKWEPTAEMIEGEYWRIVEQATDQIEVLYGADVETGKFGSGFPKATPGSDAATFYEKSGWNLNNIARFPGSMLSFEEGDISGVLVPWLYIGMCFSSFCWHVEDHHFYSLNYMHWGAPKIWYGVPGFAADKLEAAMKKHMPDLFNEQPDLLHKLVTQLSPSFLKKEGVPVYRLVQQPGDFVITFPNAYHSGFNAGFNVAEAVNVAPVDWLPHGQAAVELYRELHRKTSVSHDKLLLGAARVAVRMWWHSLQKQMPLLENNRSWVSQWQSSDTFSDLKVDLASGLEPGLVCAWQAYCGEGGILAKALKERVDMEHARRESLRLIAGEASTLSMKQMDSSYDSTDERECELCKYDLHLSAVGCECCPEIFSCLLHGHLLCSCPWSKKTLFYRYRLEQLSLLLAAVEGRPGAVARWADQDSQPSTSSPSVLQDRDLSSQAPIQHEPSKEKPIGRPPCTSSAAAGTPTHMNSGICAVKEEFETRSIHAPNLAYSLLNSGADIVRQASTNPLFPMSSAVQVPALKDNNGTVHQNAPSIREESKDLSHHSQKVVFLKSGFAKSISRKDVSGQAGVIDPSSREVHDREPGTTLESACSLSEKRHTSLSELEVILLSDDEEELNTCKLNKAGKAPIEGVAAEQETRFPAQAVNCTMENQLPSRVVNYTVDKCSVGHTFQIESKDDLSTSKYRSSSTEASMQQGRSESLPPGVSVGAPVKEVVQTATPIGSMKQLARAKHVGSLSKERATHNQSSSSIPLKLETARPDGPTASLRPLTESVTVLQRSPCASLAGPRVARVRPKREVELLDVGHLVVREGWHARHAIYPAAFKSRTRFIDVEDILKTCMYVSEIIDRGLGERPLFQVTHPTKREVYLNESVDGCWREIQNQINDAIICRRAENSNLQLPPLLPPPIGLEMFGLTSTTIIKAVEALDPLRQCSGYWEGKESPVKQGHGPGVADAQVRKPVNSVGRLKEEVQEQLPRSSTERTPDYRSVNTNSMSSVNNSSTRATPQASAHERPVSQGNLPNSFQKETQESYPVLQGLFQKANPAELRVLYRLFASEIQGVEWSSAFQALNEEVQKRFYG